jgi:hypothetical protein
MELLSNVTCLSTRMTERRGFSTMILSQNLPLLVNLTRIYRLPLVLVKALQRPRHQLCEMCAVCVPLAAQCRLSGILG